jgi:MFS transporter, ACS family, glucarate transporter
MLSASRVRWKIGGLLCTVAVVNYFLRVNISVAGDAMMKDFHLTQTQMGTVFSAFVLGYTLFQVPGGMLADRYGPRIVLGCAAVLWGMFTLLTGSVGQISMLTGLSVLNALVVLRFAFGLSEGPMFPASARAVANWFPLAERARGNGLALAGISIGSSLMPPLVAWMVLHLTWQGSFYVSSAFSILIALAWMRYVRDDPSKHWAVNAAELNRILEGSPLRSQPTAPRSATMSQLRNGNLWRLVASYTLNGYVSYVFIFWFFLYMVQVRHFGQAESAWLTTVPWVLATLTTLGGGYLSDRLVTSRLGQDWGRRIIPMACQTGAAVFLTIGARVENGYLAAAVLAVCTGLMLAVEGPYWATANEISGKNAGFTGGVLNTGGNLGGVISPTLTPLIARHLGWVHALDFAALVALAATALWLSVIPSKKMNFVSE